MAQKLKNLKRRYEGILKDTSKTSDDIERKEKKLTENHGKQIKKINKAYDNAMKVLRDKQMQKIETVERSFKEQISSLDKHKPIHKKKIEKLVEGRNEIDKFMGSLGKNNNQF